MLSAHKRWTAAPTSTLLLIPAMVTLAVASLLQTSMDGRYHQAHFNGHIMAVIYLHELFRSFLESFLLVKRTAVVEAESQVSSEAVRCEITC